MDAVRLSETLAFLRQDEEDRNLQQKLDAVIAPLEALASNPGDQDSQVNLSDALKALSEAIADMSKGYDPSQRARIVNIGAGPFFTEALMHRVESLITSNAMSPATALGEIKTIRRERQAFIDRVIKTEEGIDSFVPYTTGLNPGDAAIGFELPRSLFDNEFKDFISELRTLHRIVRVFAEVETGSAPEIKLGTISSSDPLIFLQTPPVVVASIAGSIAWLLTQWKKLEEIRKLRAETAKLGQFNKEELAEFFDKKITERLDAAVDTKVTELLAKEKLDGGRRAELESELSWALKALFARVERGMRVEVKVQLLPDSDESVSEEKSKEKEILNHVHSLSEELSFPIIDGEPILALPRTSASSGDAIPA